MPRSDRALAFNRDWSRDGLQRRITGAVLAIAISAAACGQAEEAAAPVNEVEASPTKPVSDFSIVGQDITYLSGLGHLRIPDGWQRLPNPDIPLEIEVESSRHKNSLDTWAICRLTKVSGPNIALASQEALSRHIELLWQTTVAEYEKRGIKVAIDYPAIGDGIRAKSMSYSIADRDLLVYGIWISNGPLLHGTMISCDGSSPMGAEDRADIAALAGSFHYDRP